MKKVIIITLLIYVILISVSCIFLKNFSINNYNNNSQNSMENEVDKTIYSTVTCNYIGDYDYINNADIVVITSEKRGDKYITVNAVLDAGAPDTVLQPGSYRVLSDLGSIDITIDKPGKEYVIMLDYDNNILECYEIKN